MSVFGNIDIQINNKLDLGILELIQSFLCIGWSLNDHGKITYIPLGEQDFEWEVLPLDKKDLFFNILKKKFENAEIVGIVLTWKNTNVGISCLFYPLFNKITFSIIVNRKALKGMETTDYSWYLKKIVPILINKGLSIETLHCEDTY